MEKDIVNYRQYKMGFSQKLIVAQGAVPSKFYCQPNRRKRMSDESSTSRPAFIKRQKTEMLQELIGTFERLEESQAIESAVVIENPITTVKMEKLTMCRICLVENVRMFVVSSKNLQDIYETLTKTPLVTEDRRPILACYLCYSKLKQCCHFKRKCLEAEDLFFQMLNSCEQNLFISHRTGPVNLVKTPVESINIVDYGPLENRTREFEVPIVSSIPVVSQTPYEFIAVKVEHQNVELEPEDIDNSSIVTDSDDDMPLLPIKNEVQTNKEKPPQLSQQIRKGGDSLDRPAVSQKPKLQDKCTAEQKKTEKEESNTFKTTTNMIKPVYRLAELFTKPKFKTNKTNNFDTSNKDGLTCKISQNIATASDNANKLETVNEYRNTKNITNFNISNEDELNCKISENIATESGSANNHETAVERPFKCEICTHSYILKSHLTDHMRKHTGERPFECHICHKCFAMSGHLKSHIQTHFDAEKPFKCDVCQRTFTLKNNLKAHALVHTGEKPFKCNLCQRGFKQKIHLQRHMPTHTGDKPFQCDICQKSFSLKHGLITHLQSHEKHVTGKSGRRTRSTKKRNKKNNMT